jgi:hypothetical protein
MLSQEFSDLSDNDKRRIADLVSHRRAYLFLGSGVSKDSFGPSGEMELASELRDRLAQLNDLPAGCSLQQAYSFLEPQQVQVELTDKFSCVKAGPTINCLAAIPWRRVYTL